MRASSWAMLVAGSVAGGVLESTLLAALPLPLNLFKPVIPCLVMLVLLNRPKPALVSACIAGVCMDLLSATSAGFASARLLLILIIVDYLAERVATNRSLFSAIALAFLAGILNWLFFSISAAIGRAFETQIFMEPWSYYLGSAILGSVMSAILFLVFTLFTKRFLISIKAH